MTWIRSLYFSNQGLKLFMFESLLLLEQSIINAWLFFPQDALHIYHSFSIPTASIWKQGLITLYPGFSFSASSLSPLHLNLNIPTRWIFRDTPAHIIPCSEISEGFLVLQKKTKNKILKVFTSNGGRQQAALTSTLTITSRPDSKSTSLVIPLSSVWTTIV